MESSAALTMIAGLSKDRFLPVLPALAPLMHGLSSRPRPRALPPGVVKGEAAVVVNTCDCSSVRNECLANPVARGDVLSGMPLLLAGLECLHSKRLRYQHYKGAFLLVRLCMRHIVIITFSPAVNGKWKRTQVGQSTLGLFQGMH